MKKHVLPLLLLFSSSCAMQKSVQLTPEKIATFRAVQRIYEITKEMAQELNSPCKLIVPNSLQPDPSRGLTEQGLLLDERDVPRCLETPWGRIILVASATHCYPNGWRTPLNLLLEKITTHPAKKLVTWPYENDNDADLKEGLKNRPNKITFNSIPTNILTYKKYLKENPGSTYAIKTVATKYGDISCPDVIAIQACHYRDPQEVMAEWCLLVELAKNGYVQIAATPSKLQKSRKTSPKPLETSLSKLPTLAPTSPTTPAPDLTSPKSPEQPSNPLLHQNPFILSSSSTPLQQTPEQSNSSRDQESSTLTTDATPENILPLPSRATAKRSVPTCSSVYRF